MEDHSSPILQAADRKNYAGRYAIGKSKAVPCYTKRQMKNLYPRGGFQIIGESAPAGRRDAPGLLMDGDKKLPLYPGNSGSHLLYSKKGYVCVEGGEDSYVVLLKNVLLSRILLAALCLALVIGGIFVQAHWNSLFPTVPAGPGRQLELDSGAVSWNGVLAQQTGGVTQGIAIPGYKSITIDAGKTDVKVNFVNPEDNPCYFVISLLLDNGATLYQSKMIKPGFGLYDIRLSEPLAAGEYPATIRYDTYSLDNLSPLNGAAVKITLIAH